ncbi:MAG: hypothetical protein HY231_13975 [Acidobacteria bacterium]|nr:hypothetical protein [Acidobacteriota bacterium]
MTNIKCSSCGLINFKDVQTCRKCGNALSPMQAARFDQSSGGSQVQPQWQSTISFQQELGPVNPPAKVYSLKWSLIILGAGLTLIDWLLLIYADIHPHLSSVAGPMVLIIGLSLFFVPPQYLTTMGEVSTKGKIILAIGFFVGAFLGTLNQNIMKNF